MKWPWARFIDTVTCFGILRRNPFFLQKVGCDHNLESGKRIDRCGVCGGDGNSCELNIVNYTKIYRGYGKGFSSLVEQIKLLLK